MKTFLLTDWIAEKAHLEPGALSPYSHIIMSSVALIIITVAAVLAWRKMRYTEKRLVPEAKTTVTNVLEVFSETMFGMMHDIMGDRAENHLNLIGSLFIYIFVCNMLSIIPGILPPTENINTNFACASIVFLYYNYMGIKKHGIKKYLSHMGGPIVWVAPLILVMELISHMVRPLSLSIRLFGNVMGDHLVLGIFQSITPFLVPLIFMGLAVLVAFIQAFVFSLLSIVYITLAEGSFGE